MEMASAACPLLLCCCAGCIRGEDDSTEYYDLLGIHPSASSEEIRKAWRKVSLRLHPDKLAQRGKSVGPQEQAKFAKIKDAHGVLSNPLRRQVYDRYGAKGVQWTEDPTSVDPQELMRNFTKSSTQDRARVVAAFAALAGALILFPVLLCFKIDGSPVPWVVVFLPLLLLEALWFSAQLTAVKGLARQQHAAQAQAQTRRARQKPNTAVGKARAGRTAAARCDVESSSAAAAAWEEDGSGGEEDEEEAGVSAAEDSWERSVALRVAEAGAVGTGLALLWQTLLALKLQLGPGAPWSVAAALLPLPAAELAGALHHARLAAAADAAADAAAAAADGAGGGGGAPGWDEAKTRGARELALHGAKAKEAHVLRLCAALLLVLKVAGSASGPSSSSPAWLSWWVVASPVGALLLRDLVHDAKTATAGQEPGEEAGGSSSTCEPQEGHAKAVAAACHGCCGVGLALYAVVTACLKLTGAAFSSCWVFFPVFGIVGCALLCVTLVVCCAVDDGSDTALHGPMHGGGIGSSGGGSGGSGGGGVEGRAAAAGGASSAAAPGGDRGRYGPAAAAAVGYGTTAAGRSHSHGSGGGGSGQFAPLLDAHGQAAAESPEEAKEGKPVLIDID